MPLMLDLIDPSDSIMDAPSTAPPFSPHGIIGQLPQTIHKLSPDSPPTISSFPSYPSQPKTPGTSGEFDVSALIAHATRQHEDKKANLGNPSSAYTATPIHTTHATHGSASGHGAYGMRDVGVIGDGKTGTPRKADEWFDNAYSPWKGDDAYHTTRKYPNVPNPIPGAPGSPVHHAPRPVSMFQPYDNSRVATPVNRDVATEVQSHLSALGGLLNGLVGEREEVERLRKEVEMWKGEWGRVERERKRLEGIVQDHEQCAGLNKPKSGNFTAVLIDGDGLIFHDKLLQTGYQGGQIAARTLLSALPGISAHTELSPSQGKGELVVTPNGITLPSGEQVTTEKEVGQVVVQVFLNKSGLGSTLVKAGVVASWGVFDSFWQGFSSAHDLFTVIDVGNGKEATDAKIREYLKLYAKNAHCEMILLGASHDNGYATVLSSLHTESRLSKLLLLKGYEDLAHQLKVYSSRVVSIPDLFRQTRLVSPAAAVQSFSSIVRAAPASPLAKVPAVRDPLVKVKATVDAAESVHSNSTEDSVEVIEWETATPTNKKDKHEKNVNRKGKKEREKAKKLEEKTAAAAAALASVTANDEWIEAGGRKVGKKYKGKGGIAVISVRNLKPRPCHTYYLSPWGCKAGDDCDYSHDYKLSENQMEELSRLAKEIICPYVRNNKCHFSEEECVYGHKCPRGENCSFGDTCRFNVLDNAHNEDEY